MIGAWLFAAASVVLLCWHVSRRQEAHDAHYEQVEEVLKAKGDRLKASALAQREAFARAKAARDRRIEAEAFHREARAKSQHANVRQIRVTR